MGIALFRRSSSIDDAPDESQSELSADDLRRLVELERGQRFLLQSAYAETVAALARALDSRTAGRAPTPTAYNAMRSSSPTRSLPSFWRTGASSTDFSSTTSGRSGSSTTSSASPRRSISTSGG